MSEDLRSAALRDVSGDMYALVCALLYIGDQLAEEPDAEPPEFARGVQFAARHLIEAFRGRPGRWTLDDVLLSEGGASRLRVLEERLRDFDAARARARDINALGPLRPAIMRALGAMGGNIQWTDEQIADRIIVEIAQP